MACENCYNGCPDPTPDKCVKYTGLEIAELGISTGDPLSLVLEKITTAITLMFKGNDIIPRVDPADICDLIQSYLPCCDPIDLNVLLTAIVKAICDIEARINAMRDELITLYSTYNIDCFTEVTAASNTYDVLESTIFKICIVANDLAATKLNLSTNYVLKSEVNGYIQAYLAGIPASTNQSGKMIPYVIYAYYGERTGIFDATGAGIGTWAKVYLCNGNHLTPDLRGLVLVGATDMRVGGFKPEVDPGLGNPTYIPLNPTSAGGAVQGKNKTVLIEAQMPTHSHIATVAFNDPGHYHALGGSVAIRNGSGPDAFSNNDNIPTSDITNTLSKTTGITVSVSNSTAGQGLAHDNFQPGVGIDYIMFIP